MSELEIVFDSVPAEALTRLVNEGVDLHNVAATGIAEWYPVNFFHPPGHAKFFLRKRLTAARAGDAAD